MKLLIISDAKAGHLNQSIAFAKLKQIDFDIITIHNRFKFLTYILDFLHLYFNLFALHVKENTYKAVVSTGSSTYYANKYLAKKLHIPSVAIMLPRGFRYSDFDAIIAASHDNPPQKPNIITLPLNLSINEPKGLITKIASKSLGIIIGGDNAIFSMTPECIQTSLDAIFQAYPNHLKYITTSRRTAPQIDLLLQQYAFDYAVIYAKTPTINPVADFIAVCDELFITIDSTSMLSEARAHSDANIHVITLPSNKQNTKFHTLANTIQTMKTKFDYRPYLDRILL